MFMEVLFNIQERLGEIQSVYLTESQCSLAGNTFFSNTDINPNNYSHHLYSTHKILDRFTPANC